MSKATELAKLSMGYITPNQRPRCESCKHLEVAFRNPDSKYESRVFRCKPGNFETIKLAHCAKWEPSK